jgi:hypothetical protein
MANGLDAEQIPLTEGRRENGVRPGNKPQEQYKIEAKGRLPAR